MGRKGAGKKLDLPSLTLDDVVTDLMGMASSGALSSEAFESTEAGRSGLLARAPVASKPTPNVSQAPPFDLEDLYTFGPEELRERWQIERDAAAELKTLTLDSTYQLCDTFLRSMGTLDDSANVMSATFPPQLDQLRENMQRAIAVIREMQGMPAEPEAAPETPPADAPEPAPAAPDTADEEHGGSDGGDAEADAAAAV